MFSNLEIVLICSIIVISIMVIIRHFYLKYTLCGKQYISELKILNQQNNFEKNLKLNNNVFTDDFLKKLEECTKLIENKNTQNIQQNNMMQFKCIFNKNAPFELLDVSDNFLKLIGVATFNDLLNFYYKRRKSVLTSCISESFENNIQNNNQSIKIIFEDLFKVNKNEYNKVVDILKEKNTISIKNAKIELNSDVYNTKIKLLYNLYIDDLDRMIIEFNIFSIKPRLRNPFNDNIDTIFYKEIMHNFIVDVPYPIIIVNHTGIKFLNKSACDWFNLPYFSIEINMNEETNNEKEKIHMHDLFDQIDPNLVDIIKDNINDQSNRYGFYKEYFFEHKDINSKVLTVKNIPIELIIQAEAFYNINNKKELFISIRDSTNIHKYIKEHKDCSNNNDYVIDRNNSQISEYIEKLNIYNSFFKDFFSNTNVVSFGRINIDTRNIVLSNKLFEQIIKYDKYKDRYATIIENIINEYNSEKNNEREDNLYIYDITYNDRVMKLIYTYNKNQNAIDILIIENYFGDYLSNHSLSLLKNIYNTSDKPIIVVNKKTKIISMNDTFKNLYYDPKKQIEDTSLLDLVPETDKNKVKRAISDAIKFNSYNLKDVITITTENGKKSCKLKCLKTYGKIDNEEFITITIFPIQD